MTKPPFRAVFLLAQNSNVLRHSRCTIKDCHGGEGEIRTHGTVARTTDFKSVALDRSATSPWWIFSCGRSVAYGEIFSKGESKNAR